MYKKGKQTNKMQEGLNLHAFIYLFGFFPLFSHTNTHIQSKINIIILILKTKNKRTTRMNRIRMYQLRNCYFCLFVYLVALYLSWSSYNSNANRNKIVCVYRIIFLLCLHFYLKL